MRTTIFFRFGLLALGMLALSACATPKQPPMPMGDLKIAVARYTQPRHAGELLAGYLPETVTLIEPKVLSVLDEEFSEVLRAESKNRFIGGDRAGACAQTAKTRQAAVRMWAAVGRCMGTDILVVPQILEWRERAGGEMGVALPARVVMDTFVIDVNNEELISRSRYDETQSALADNLLETGKFFKRGGKWVTARALAREGMEKAVKDLGL
jgi:hypothetical protein